MCGSNRQPMNPPTYPREGRALIAQPRGWCYGWGGWLRRIQRIADPGTPFARRESGQCRTTESALTAAAYGDGTVRCPANDALRCSMDSPCLRNKVLPPSQEGHAKKSAILTD